MILLVQWRNAFTLPLVWLFSRVLCAKWYRVLVSLWVSFQLTWKHLCMQFIQFAHGHPLHTYLWLHFYRGTTYPGSCLNWKQFSTQVIPNGPSHHSDANKTILMRLYVLLFSDRDDDSVQFLMRGYNKSESIWKNYFKYAVGYCGCIFHLSFSSISLIFSYFTYGTLNREVLFIPFKLMWESYVNSWLVMFRKERHLNITFYSHKIAMGSTNKFNWLCCGNLLHYLRL